MEGDKVVAVFSCDRYADYENATFHVRFKIVRSDTKMAEPTPNHKPFMEDNKKKRSCEYDFKKTYEKPKCRATLLAPLGWQVRRKKVRLIR